MTGNSQEPLMIVEDGFDPSTLRIELHGDLDYVTAEDLLSAVTARLRQERPAPRRVLLDCAGLELCDSAGLSALIVVHRQAKAVGAGFHLGNRSAALNRLLDVTGTLDYLVEEHDDAQQHSS